MTNHPVDLQPLSSLVSKMEESETIKMAQMSRDLAAQGHDVINLSLGEPDFDTPAHIKEAAKVALDQGYTKYTPVPGLPELRAAIVQKFKRDNQLHFTAHEVMVSNGAKQCIANLCLALLDPGDEVIIFAPYWVSYKAIVDMTGGVSVPVFAGIADDYKPGPAQIEAAITDRTKMVIFSSPCNPTGSVFTKAELEAIAAVFAKHPNIFIVSDEIYEYINFTEEGHFSIGSIESVKNQTITVNGFAKGFAMTGWRLGYMAGPEWIIQACSKIQGQFTSGANAFGQKAAAHALLADLSPTFEMRKAFQKRRDLILGLLAEIPGLQLNHPSGAFYIFPDISTFFGKTDGHMTIGDSGDFCDFVLLNAHVGTVAGSAFGAPNCFRLSYAASETQLIDAAGRMKKALEKLR